ARSRQVSQLPSLSDWSSTRDLLDGDHRDVGRYSPHRKSYRVSDGNRLLNLRGSDAKAHGHGGHEFVDLAVRDDEHAELGEDPAHHALDRPLALHAAHRGGARRRQLPPAAGRPPPPPPRAPPPPPQPAETGST